MRKYSLYVDSHRYYESNSLQAILETILEFIDVDVRASCRIYAHDGGTIMYSFDEAMEVFRRRLKNTKTNWKQEGF